MTLRPGDVPTGESKYGVAVCDERAHAGEVLFSLRGADQREPATDFWSSANCEEGGRLGLAQRA